MTTTICYTLGNLFQAEFALFIFGCLIGFVIATLLFTLLFDRFDKVSRNRCKDCGIFLPCKKHNEILNKIDEKLNKMEER